MKDLQKRVAVNETSMINNLVQNLEQVYVERIIEPLETLDRQDFTEFLNRQIPTVIGAFELATKNHLTQLLKLELYVGAGIDINPYQEAELLRIFWGKSWYKHGLEQMTERLKEQLLFDYNQSIDTKMFQDLARDSALTELKSIKRTIISESIVAINWGRELKYRIEDPTGQYMYRWSVYNDARTSPQCKEIVRRVDLAGGKLPISELKALVNLVAVQFDPKWQFRDWFAHYNCRSTLQRVVI